MKRRAGGFPELVAVIPSEVVAAWKAVMGGNLLHRAAADANTLRSDVFMLKGGADLKEIVDGFNKIGASSRDLIEVLKSVKAAGALHADLVIR